MQQASVSTKPSLDALPSLGRQPFRESAEDNYVYHNVCMCLYNRALMWCVHVQMGTHGGWGDKGQRALSPTITLCLMFFWRQCLSLNLNLAGSTRLAGQKVPGIFLCLFPQGTEVPSF